MEIPTPEEIEARRRARQTPHKDSLRARILEALEKDGRAYVTPNDDEYAVAEYVADEFRDKGWKVRVGSGQRDGAWMIVEPEKPNT
jgi:hypothetical protein